MDDGTLIFLYVTLTVQTIALCVIAGRLAPISRKFSNEEKARDLEELRRDLIVQKAKNGKQLGPYSIAEIRLKHIEGFLSPEDYVWKDGDEDWAQLKDSPHFQLVPSEPFIFPILFFSVSIFAVAIILIWVWYVMN